MYTEWYKQCAGLKEDKDNLCISRLSLSEWYWRCVCAVWVCRVLAVLFTIFSFMVVWSECLFFVKSPVLSVFAVFINLAKENYDYVYIEVTVQFYSLNNTVKPRLSGIQLSGNTAIRTVCLGNENSQRLIAPFIRISVFPEPDSSLGNQTMFYNDQRSVLSRHAPRLSDSKNTASHIRA